MTYEWQDIPGFGHIEPMAARDPYSRPALFERLEILRLARGETQAEFCRRWGISASQYAHYKNADQGLTTPLAGKLCALAGVDFNYLYRDMWDRVPIDLLDKMREIESRYLAGETFDKIQDSIIAKGAETEASSAPPSRRRRRGNSVPKPGRA